MKKTIVIISVLVVALICFAGCTPKNIINNVHEAQLSQLYDEIEKMEAMYTKQIDDLNKYIIDHEIYSEAAEEIPVEIPVEIPKKYTLMGLKNLNNIPTLTFNEEDGTFSFVFDNFSDDILTGDYEIIDNTLSAITYDDKFYYTFEIMDENSLKFIAENSSEIPPIISTIGYPVEDRTVFKLAK